MADEKLLRAHVRERLAAYKVPKRIVITGEALRGPNGKADYKRATALAARALDSADV